MTIARAFNAEASQVERNEPCVEMNFPYRHLPHRIDQVIDGFVVDPVISRRAHAGPVLTAPVRWPSTVARNVRGMEHANELGWSPVG